MPSTPKSFSEEKEDFLKNEEAFRKKARDAQEAHNKQLLMDAITQKVQIEMQNEEREIDKQYKKDVAIFEHAVEHMEPFKGYDSPLSILLKLLNFYNKLAPLVAHNFGEAFKELPVFSHFDSGCKSVKAWILYQKELLTAENAGPIVLPVITHKVSLDTTGQLCSQPLQFLQDVATKAKLSPKDFDALNDDFLMVVDGWLQLHSDKPAYRVNKTDRKVYTYDPDNDKWSSVALNQKQFEDLRDKPVTGLTAYMQKNLGMQSEFTLEEKPSPKPTFK